MNKFHQSVSYVFDELKVMHRNGHTSLRASKSELQALIRQLPDSPPLPPASAVAESAELPSPGATSAALREHFERKNKSTATVPPASRTPSPAAPSAKPPAPTAPAPAAVLPPPSGDRAERLVALRQTTEACEKCPLLASSRQHVVFGAGSVDADVLFVGEAPGAEEDRSGQPFADTDGELLTKIIGAMGLTRESVYITNVLKCRPDMGTGLAGTRPPAPEEMANCMPYLKQQIEIIRPKAVVAMGALAMEGMFGLKSPIYKMRGRWHMLDATPVMATYHPSFLIQQPELANKRTLWEDMLQVMERLALPISPRQQNFFCEKPPTTR